MVFELTFHYVACQNVSRMASETEQYRA